jgi:hypothetical protein
VTGIDKELVTDVITMVCKTETIEERENND